MSKLLVILSAVMCNVSGFYEGYVDLLSAACAIVQCGVRTNVLSLDDSTFHVRQHCTIRWAHFL